MDTIDNITVIELAGTFDSNSAQDVQNRLLQIAEQESKVLLDMSGVTFMSSAGLRTLLLLYRKISEHAGDVALVGLSDEIKDIMSITGFLEFFSTFDNRHSGLRALQ